MASGSIPKTFRSITSVQVSTSDFNGKHYVHLRRGPHTAANALWVDLAHLGLSNEEIAIANRQLKQWSVALW